MAERLADMGVGGTMVPNTAMMLSGGLRDTSRKPIDIRAIGLQRIEVLDRERPVDKAKVAELAESIKREGLLQPIGVRRSKTGGPVRLVYGAHRLAAARLIAEADPTQDAIAAVIFPPEMPDWACKMAEIAENVHRKELSPKQRAAQTTIYAGMEKKYGQTRLAPRGGVAKKPHQPNGSGDVAEKTQPTTTQKVATTLGINDDTVRHRVRTASKLAEREGVAFDAPKTPEHLTGDQMIAIGEAAMAAADNDDKEALAQGKNRRYVKPQEPSGETQVTVRLDVVDPAPFVAWCRKRINGQHKPMSLDMLRAYRKALDELIAEYEAKP